MGYREAARPRLKQGDRVCICIPFTERVRMRFRGQSATAS